MDRPGLAQRMQQERNVLSRAELEELGVSNTVITSRVRYGEWIRPFRGVYVLSPITPDFDQRMACVAKWARGQPFAFYAETAGYIHGLRKNPPTVIEIIAPLSSPLRSNERCRVRRSDLDLDTRSTPRVTSIEQTVADLVHAAADRTTALEILIQGIQKRMRIERFLEIVRRRKRHRHSKFVELVLEITADGVESHLELAYLRRIERAHGLPRSEAQKRERIRGRWIRSDRWYKDLKVRAELDGELAHPGRMTDADMMRDNDVRLALDEITLRYRWPQVNNVPCLVAAQVAVALQMRGWKGAPRPCSPTCSVEAHITDLLSRDHPQIAPDNP